MTIDVFGKCLAKLDVHLKDPATDVEAIFFALDLNSNGVVSEEEFERAVQPTILHRAEKGLPMIVDEIVKDTFRSTIADAEVELAKVDEAFLKTHHDFVLAGKGFGVSFWGEHWRFQMFKDFYSSVRKNRLNNLLENLAKIAAGDRTWIKKSIEDPTIAIELPGEKNWNAVGEYARLWREHLREGGLGANPCNNADSSG